MKKFKAVIGYIFYHWNKIHYMLLSIKLGDVATQLCHMDAFSGEYSVTTEDLL
jgi:hypothetical protein